MQFCQSLKNLLVLIYAKLHSKSCDYLYKFIFWCLRFPLSSATILRLLSLSFRSLPLFRAYLFQPWHVQLIVMPMIISHITLSDGYLFRATNQQGHMVDKPLLSSTGESCFKKYIRDAQIDSGESLHNFRSGCAITLALSGSPLADVMSRVGWTNLKTALYYIKLADIIRAGAPSDLLASNASSHKSQEASCHYAECNMLKHFITAFPLSTSSVLKGPLAS